jgi:hypothetical protein
VCWGASLKRTIGSGGSDFGFGGIRDAVAVVFDTRGGEENALAPVAHITILNGIGSELRWDSASNVTLYAIPCDALFFVLCSACNLYFGIF